MAHEEKLRMEYTVTDRRPPCTGRHLTAGVENEVRWAHQRTGMDSQPDDRLRKGTALGLLVPGTDYLRRDFKFGTGSLT